MTDAPDDSAHLPAARVGDTDRALVAQKLQIAVDEGRLDLMELDSRLVAVYAAKTAAELVAVTADLPDITAAPIELRTKSGFRDKSGYWVVPAEITAETRSGTIKLDFTAASYAHRGIAVHAEIGSGTLLLIVPSGWRVDLDQVRVGSGTVANKVRGPQISGAPVVRVDGRVGSGLIRARYPRRSFLAWLQRRPY